MVKSEIGKLLIDRELNGGSASVGEKNAFDGLMCLRFYGVKGLIARHCCLQDLDVNNALVLV